MSAKHAARRTGTDVDDGLEGAHGRGDVLSDDRELGDDALCARTMTVRRRDRALNAAIQRTCLPMMTLSRALEAAAIST